MNGNDCSAVLFTGPFGNSDERAARLIAGSGEIEVLAIDSLERVVVTCDSVLGAFGVVPIEDNLHGLFTESMSSLIFKSTNTHIVQTVLLSETIFVQTTDPKITPQVAYSHPAILERFADVLAMLGIFGEAAASTHHACQTVQSQGSPLAVALAPDVVAARYGMVHHKSFDRYAVDVNTKYGLLGRSRLDSTAPEVMLLFAHPIEDKSGTLSTMLDVFKTRSINMTTLRSIPMGEMRPHGFLVELMTLNDFGVMAEAIRALQRSGVRVKIIGLYNYTPLPQDDAFSINVPGLLEGPEDFNAWALRAGYLQGE